MKVLKANQWQPLCAISDLVENAGICALVDGEQVAIFYLPAEIPRVYAIGAVARHRR